jgi:hypothetical protein
MDEDKFVEYCRSVAQEFLGRVDRMQVFVKHNLTVGNARETILRDFLATHTPEPFRVGQGFMCDPTEEDRVSRQCDILVYNGAKYPLVYEDGAVKVVWPDSVVMTIEVKTRINKKEIEGALKNIKSVKSTAERHDDKSPVKAMVFAFKSSIKTPRLKKHLCEFLPPKPEYRPDALLVFEKGWIVEHKSSRKQYCIWESREDDGSALLTHLLLDLFDATSSWLNGRSSPASLLSELRGQRFQKIDEFCP